jgi:hypothetical protein
MILISHRGNINKKNPSLENNPSYVDIALEMGFQVEIDVWFIEGEFFLGHDSAQYKINIEWILKRKSFLWVHCKNILAIEEFNDISKNPSYSEINYFFHNTDDLTVTSKGFLWVYPGKQPVKNSIAVSPELFTDDLNSCLGICSDFINDYKSI